MCVVCERLAARLGTGGNMPSPQDGAIAQLVERFHGMEEVAGSIPASSTFSPDVPQAYMLGGFVAGEGCFTTGVRGSRFADGTPVRKFVFTVEVADRDLQMLERLQAALNCGSIRLKASRCGHLPSAAFSIRSHKAHRERTIPFMDRYLLPSAKRAQYEAWKEALAAYEIAHPTRWGLGPSSCSIKGCSGPVRGRGLCRRHYYRATGY